MEKTISIAIVEDDTKLAKLTGDYLEKNGYRVKYAADGEEGVDVVLNSPTDLVLLDMHMPKLDGLAVCRALNSLNFQGKILFLTTSEDDFDHVAALELGADDFVSKPVLPRVLLANLC